MPKKVIELNTILTPESLASSIGNMWVRWDQARSGWKKEKREIRNYVFATDTTSTTNAALPWKNTTTIPKLCQIRDNLHANYMAALFPHEDWFTWYALSADGVAKNKQRVIIQYMRNKLNISGFREEVSKLVLDYIDYGNAFAEVIYVAERHTDPEKLSVYSYTGPRVRRISPFDIVFDITAADWKAAPKITRSFMGLGQLKKMALDRPQEQWIVTAIEKSEELRKAFSGFTSDMKYKSEPFAIDGFGSLYDYFTSGLIEVLEFEGDLYDISTGELKENRRIVVLDRMHIALDQPYSSWLGISNKEHTGWRLRPDSLLAAGPLDNLVGLQYRIDHLENLKADVFDQIAHPVVYQKGQVEDWEWGPGERIYGDTESDVSVLRPDATALNADMQIANILALMEELAGAPKQAMGIRTPGEKTAYEVQTLESAAGRIFQNKISHFEQTFLEPLLNQMLEAARRNIDITDQVRIQDDDLGVTEFLNITKEDLTAKGRLIPMGARHFVRRAQLVQNLNNLGNSAIYQDQSVNAHISGLGIATLLEELLGLDRYKLVRPNVRVAETMDTQLAMTEAQRIVQESSMVDPNMGPIAEEDLAALEEEDDFDDGEEEGVPK